jgi:hypothetical protein
MLKLDTSGILLEAIRRHPTAEGTRGSRWRIGNAELLDSEAVWFHFGREGKNALLPQVDGNGDFLEVPYPYAPYTHAVLDTKLQVCAVAHDPALFGSPEAAGRALERILNLSDTTRSLLTRFEVSPIKEPFDFLETLRRAHAVHSLWLLTRRPNPFDMEEDLVKPTSRVLERLNGTEVRTTFSGESLSVNTPEVAEIIKSTAARGGDAGARISDEPHSKPRKIRLTKSLASICVNTGANFKDALLCALSKTRGLYQRIRGEEKEPMPSLEDSTKTG